MKIKSLTISNFLIIGEAKINLDNRGLLLVQGENEDDSSANSNGAGKSSIVDAISWCLFGETARGVSGDSVVNNTIGKDCCVSVIVQDGDKEYGISRYRKHSVRQNDLTVWLWQEGGLALELDKGTTKLTQGVVDRIVGCSYEVFIAAVYSGQEMMPDLPAMTDKQLKMIVEEAAGIERLQAAHEVALFKNKMMQVEADAKSSQLDLNKALLSSNEEELRTLTDMEAKHEVVRSGNIRDKTIALGVKEEFKDKLPSSHPELREELIKEMALLIAKIDNPAEKENLKVHAGNVKSAESRIAVTETESRIANRTARDLKLGLEKFDELLGTECTECGKEYCGEDLIHAMANAKSKLRLSLLNLKTCKEHEEKAKELLNIALTEQKTFIDTLTDVSELLKRHSNLNAQVSESNKRELKHKEVNAEIDALILSIEQEQERENPFTAMVKNRSGEIDSLKVKNKSITAELFLLMEKCNVSLQAIEVFSRTGVRAHILDTVTPFLNERTAEYLGTLTDGNITASWSTLNKTAKGDLREKFGIAVAKRNGSENFAGLSGGEKRKVRLSTSMALQDLVASRATKPIEFQLYDEIDDALDVSGLERLMTILDKRGREKGTVIVISHNDLGAWIDQSVTVTNSGGVSTIEDR
jgi:DNA repair exonuclease SbcCD ATPase subunit